MLKVWTVAIPIETNGAVIWSSKRELVNCEKLIKL
jgi:hypothetical protein